MILSGAAYYGIAAAVVEEAVFRGAILKSLESRWNRKVAVPASSVLFGAVHMLGASLSLVSPVQTASGRYGSRNPVCTDRL
ncbi:MAG: lysostaphin resistance A-like protein [[Clostridium] scindens]